MSNNLTFEDVAQILKTIKSLYDLKEDINFYNENVAALHSGNIYLMCERLDITIDKYKSSIDQLSAVTKVGRVFQPTMTQEKIYNDLSYATSNIPLYVAFDKLKEKGLEFMLKQFFSENEEEQHG